MVYINYIRALRINKYMFSFHFTLKFACKSITTINLSAYFTRSVPQAQAAESLLIVKPTKGRLCGAQDETKALYIPRMVSDSGIWSTDTDIALIRTAAEALLSQCHHTRDPICLPGETHLGPYSRTSLGYIIGFGLVEMAIRDGNPKPTIYRNLYENTSPAHHRLQNKTIWEKPINCNEPRWVKPKIGVTL